MRPFIVALLLATFAATTAQAHHSAAMFDKNKPTTVQATVKEFQWTNPHSWLNIVTQQDASKIIALEGPAPSVMIRLGFKHSDVKVGDKLVITYFPMKDGRPGGLLNKVVSGSRVLVNFNNGG